jgi:hypothetical protein
MTKLIVALRNFANVPKSIKFDVFLLPCSSVVLQRTNVNIKIQKSDAIDLERSTMERSRNIYTFSVILPG